MHYVKLAALLLSNRKSLVPIILVLLAVPVGLLTVISAVIMSVPAAPTDLFPAYQRAAAGAPVPLSYEQLMAVDAVRFRQDFSRVTEQTLAETVALFLLCQEVEDPDTGEKTVECDDKSIEQAMDDMHMAPEDRQMVRNMIQQGFHQPSPPGGAPFDPGGFYTWPAICNNITEYFGPRIHPIKGTPDFHTGVDIACDPFSSIFAAANGTVIYAGWSGGYGNIVRINHGTFITAYAHLVNFDVRPGQVVQAGDVIGWEGTTGNSTGEHLHFEWWVDGEPTNPLAYYGGGGMGR